MAANVLTEQFRAATVEGLKNGAVMMKLWKKGWNKSAAQRWLISSAGRPNLRTDLFRHLAAASFAQFMDFLHQNILGRRREPTVRRVETARLVAAFGQHAR